MKVNFEVYTRELNQREIVIGQFENSNIAYDFLNDRQARIEAFIVVQLRELFNCPACGNFRDSKIPVIKHVREFHQFSGLKNAKEFVEQWSQR